MGTLISIKKKILQDWHRSPPEHPVNPNGPSPWDKVRRNSWAIMADLALETKSLTVSHLLISIRMHWINVCFKMRMVYLFTHMPWILYRINIFFTILLFLVWNCILKMILSRTYKFQCVLHYLGIISQL